MKVWRGGESASGTAVPYKLLLAGSPEVLTGVLGFSPGETKAWLDLPEGSGPGVYELTLATNNAAASERLTIIDDSDIHLWGLRVATVPSNPDLMALLYRGPMELGFSFEFSENLQSWSPAMDAEFRGQMEPRANSTTGLITLWTVPRITGARYFRVRGVTGLFSVHWTQALAGGGTLVLGNVESFGFGGSTEAVLRFLPDGSIDKSWGNEGMLVFSTQPSQGIGGSSETASATLYPDGRVWIEYCRFPGSFEVPRCCCWTVKYDSEGMFESTTSLP